MLCLLTQAQKTVTLVMLGVVRVQGNLELQWDLVLILTMACSILVRKKAAHQYTHAPSNEAAAILHRLRLIRLQSVVEALLHTLA